MGAGSLRFTLQEARFTGGIVYGFLRLEAQFWTT